MPSDTRRTGVSAPQVWQRLRSVVDDPTAKDTDHSLMREAGITGGPLRALRHLPLTGSMPMRELAGLMGCDNSYVTGLIDALEQHGLARRVPHPTDRRVKVITLSASGRRLAQRARSSYETPPASFDTLTAAELGTLDRLLRKLDPGTTSA